MTEPTTPPATTVVGFEIPTDMMPYIISALRGQYSGPDRDTLTDRELIDTVLLGWVTAAMVADATDGIPKQREPETGDLTPLYRQQVDMVTEAVRRDAARLKRGPQA